MKTMNSVLIKFVIPALILAGCSAATYEYTSMPLSQTVANKNFRVEFTPEKANANFFSRFKLSVENLSADSIEIDWNLTAYILDGKNRGPFVWEGIDPENIKTKTVPKTTILPGRTVSLKIFPLTKLARAKLSDPGVGTDRAGLYGGILPPGKNGIRLAILANAKLDHQVLTVVIAEQKK